MFFIGVFGIQQKQKDLSVRRNIICPVCKGLGSYEVIKSYSYFHMFFIPVLKWNIRYYIRTSCCKKIIQVNSDVGKKIEQGEDIELQYKDLEELHTLVDPNQCYN